MERDHPQDFLDSVRGRPRTTSRGAPPLVSLPAVWPDLLDALPEADHALAERVLASQLIEARDEDLAVEINRRPGALCFAVIRGAVLKKTTLAERDALELLGPGDVLIPPLNAERQLDSLAISRYLAHGTVALVAIDEPFRQAARRWPALSDLLHDRLAQQVHRASVNFAILHLARVEDRILCLFRILAERYGRVSGGKVTLDLPLTHEVIGGLVGSRRSTVSLALGKLAETGQVERLDDGAWEFDLSLVTD